MITRPILRIALSALVVLGATSPPVEAKPTPPNIVYILADDMGYGDVSCLNPESKIPTPSIDRMADEGMIFTDAHSPSAVCTPTRYGVLTGRYSWRTRLKKGVLYGYDPHLIEEGRVTVASFLKENGYRTAAVGKWHLGMDFSTTDGRDPVASGGKNVDWKGTTQNGPIANGFDTFYGISASLDMHPYIYIDNDRFVGECTTEKAFHRPGPAHVDFEAVDVMPVFTRKAVEVIENSESERPFFLYLALSAPHTPIVPTEEFRGKNTLGEYGDFSMQVDATVGEILNAIDKKGIVDNTLVVFTSDNGCAPYIGVADLEKKGHFPSHVFRGYKADIFEGGHRVPYVVRWPAEIEAGKQSAETVCLTDLLATCAAILGKELPNGSGEDSCDILPAMLGKPLETPLREATVHHSINGSFAIRKGKWKLILCPDSGGWSAPKPSKKQNSDLPPLQLYNLEEDIAETTNLHDRHPEVVKELSALLERYKAEGRSVPRI